VSPSDKVALVTGGASGIGLATAERFAKDGTRVAIVDLRSDAAEQAARRVAAASHPDVAAFACDVSDEAAVTRSVEAVLAHFGRWDVLVNNAGLMTFAPFESLTTDDWLRVLRVDLLGAFYFSREAFRRMAPGGAIVNVSSIHAEETTPGVAHYAAAKAAMVSLTRSAAIEGGPRGLRANAVLPGAIDTPMLWNNPNVKSGLEKIERAKVGSPADVAAAIVYLAGDDARFVQGVAMRVDGGRLTRL
jgi:meso-butanediol dehydrogenase/(S,S)-butanediol dehydrogenase/diacetyl reductase